jgi:hypothetical protein
MVSNVNSIITSGDLGGGLIPTEYATQIIQDAPSRVCPSPACVRFA